MGKGKNEKIILSSIGLLLVAVGGGWPSPLSFFPIILCVSGYSLLIFTGTNYFRCIYPDLGIILLPHIGLIVEVIKPILLWRFDKSSNYMLYVLAQVVPAILLLILSLHYIQYFANLKSGIEVKQKPMYLCIFMLALFKAVEVASSISNLPLYIFISWGFFYGYGFFIAFLLTPLERRIREAIL